MVNQDQSTQSQALHKPLKQETKKLFTLSKQVDSQTSVSYVWLAN